MGVNNSGSILARALPPSSSSAAGAQDPDEALTGPGSDDDSGPLQNSPVEDTRRTPQSAVTGASTLDRAAAKERLKSTPTHVVFSDSFVTVVSDQKLTKAQGQALASKVKNAYDYDTRTEAWTNTAPLAAKLQVDALSKSAFDQLLGGDSTGIAGVTLGPDEMAVPANLIATATPDDDDTIAHESNHVQDFREGGKFVDRVPRFVQEGKAYIQGDNYPIALGEDQKDPVLPALAKALGGFTGADAKDVVEHYVTGQDSANAGQNGFRDEIMGALFVEFLRTDLGGTGVKDAVPKLAQVVEDVGAGKTWSSAFKKQFGVTPKVAEAQYEAFVTKTEGDPAARLKGTLWEPYLAGGASPKP